MDVKTVCLGMLTRGPASGYDLKKNFESTFGHFFAAGYGSIYPALSALAEQSLVSCEEIPQDGKPDRKVYSITAKGREILMQGLNNPAPAHKVRSEFLATLFFADLMTNQQVDTVIDNRLGEARQILKTLASMDLDNADRWPPGARFVAGFGQAMAETCCRYIEEHRELLLEETQPEPEAVRS